MKPFGLIVWLLLLAVPLRASYDEDRRSALERCYAPIISDEALQELGAQLLKLAGPSPVRPSVDRQTASRLPYIDYLVAEGDKLAARQMLGGDLLTLDWVEDPFMFLHLSRIVELSEKVGRPIGTIEGYVTDKLAERVRAGELPLERWKKTFSARRRQNWDVRLEPRGGKTFLIFQRLN